MEFTIFKKTGEIHFDHNGLDDYDGDNGYYDEINTPDEQVHSDVIDMIIRDYFISELRSTEREVIKTVLSSLFSDLDLYDKAIKTYYDELQSKYE